jgi:hypothetical protein
LKGLHEPCEFEN